MHAFWNVPELVQTVFAFLDNKTRIGAASVCRTFWLNTLPFTWKVVNDFYTLMQLFPDDSMAKGPEDDMEPFTLKRALDESDWERFLLHSRYTKLLAVSFSDYHHNQYQQLLPTLPSRAILPNLTRVRFSLLDEVEGADSETIKLFLPNTLSFVRVRVSENATGSAEAVLGVLAMTELPSFASFAIETSDFQGGEGLGSAVSQVLRAHQTIETVRISMGPNNNIYEFLCTAGQLPKLLHLDMIDYDGQTVVEEPEILSLPHDNLFPVLRTLKLSGAPDFITALSSRVNSGEMEEIELYLDTYNRFEDFETEYAAQFVGYFRFIGRFAHLRTLFLELQVSISDEALFPVLECRELEAFTIVVSGPSALWLPEDSLVKMGRAWPHLKEMNLNLFSAFHSRNKYIRLSHLRVIAREFRSLVQLTIGFDATTYGNEGFQFDDTVTMEANELRELDVGLSLLDDDTSGKIVSLFQAWWPKLQSVASSTPLPYWISVVTAFQKSDI
ncbi:hypothetical protein FRC00_006441 [Tulasnella sp. 408]|nr:hypothetical protein FRC00_006441 [Tulasnella sp. 408]